MCEKDGWKKKWLIPTSPMWLGTMQTFQLGLRPSKGAPTDNNQRNSKLVLDTVQRWKSESCSGRDNRKLLNYKVSLIRY